MGSRLLESVEKFERIVALVNKYIEMSKEDVANFMDGGNEGWDCGDEEQAEWLNFTSDNIIADWIIAGRE
jgi:hypothetical protein